MIAEHVGKKIRDDREPDLGPGMDLWEAAERLAGNLKVAEEWVRAAKGEEEAAMLLEDAYRIRDEIEETYATVCLDREIQRHVADFGPPPGLTREQGEELARLAVRCDCLVHAYGILSEVPSESFGALSRYVVMGVLWREKEAAEREIDRLRAEYGLKEQATGQKEEV